MPVLINLILKEKMRTEVKMVWQYLSITSLLSRFTVSQLLAICRCYCYKNTYDFFKQDKLNKYTYLTQMLTAIKVIWESSQKDAIA